MNKAIFLDRDGTVITDCGYLADADGVELLSGVGESLRALADVGFALVLITNQSGVGRGMFGIDAVHVQHRRLEELLKPFGVAFDLVKICPHAPEDECDCRKPEPKMVLEAAAELAIDNSLSWMIGDKPSDVLAGKTAGCRTILLGRAECDDADFRCANLVEATKVVLSHGA